MTAWFLLPALRQWRSRRPDVRLELSEFSNIDVMVELLEAGRTDVVFGPRPTRTDAHVKVLGTEEFVVVAGAQHPFAELSGVPFHALKGEPYVHLDTSHGMAGWIDRLAARHDVVLDPVLRTRSQRTAAQLAAAGIGVAILPLSALPPQPVGTVRRLRPGISRDVASIVAARLNSLVQQFVIAVTKQ